MRLRPAAVLLPLALAGCVRGRPAAARPGNTAVLEVRNEYLAPVNVYAVRQGAQTNFRVGQVFAGRTERFRLDPQIYGGGVPIAFAAVPSSLQGSASAARATSGTFTLRPGDVVRFRVSSDLRSSAASLDY